jgi:hypothetical protein
MYLKGLLDSIIAQVINPSLCHIYTEMVVKAIESIKAQKMRFVTGF